MDYYNNYYVYFKIGSISYLECFILFFYIKCKLIFVVILLLYGAKNYQQQRFIKNRFPK